MTRWNLQVDDETDRSVRAFLARQGKRDEDLSRFVIDAVRGELLRHAVRDVQSQNTDLSADDALKLAREAVDWARAHPS